MAQSQAAAEEGEFIASYFDCWRPEPYPGWQVMTNSRGSIGHADNYESLSYINEHPERWKWGANYYTDEAKTLRAGTSNNRLPGTRDGVKRYAISAYAFSEDHSNDVWVTQGKLLQDGKGTGIDLKIYLNDTLKFETVVNESNLFQSKLGPVRKGDIVYVAIASEGTKAQNVRLLYTIEAFPRDSIPPPPVQRVHPPTDVAVPVLSLRTLKADEEYLQKHKSLCDGLLEQKPDLVFIGDSITVRLGTQEMLKERFGAQYKPGMFAISGDLIQNVLWRIENGPLADIKPKAIVLLIGTNNTQRYTAEEITAGIQKIVQTLRQQTPDTEIVLMGIFPRGQSINNNPAYEKIKKVNEELAALAKETNRVVFLDIGDRLIEADGTISKEIMPDHLHVAPKGLDIWADALTPVLARIFDSSAAGATQP